MKYIFSFACIFFSVIAFAQGRDPGVVTGAQPKDTTTKPLVYMYVEQMPSAPYDIPEYLSKNFHCTDSTVEGRVITKFIVNEDGRLSDVTILKGIGSACENDLKKLIEKMPPWKPGKQNGKAVKVYFSLPVVIRWD